MDNRILKNLIIDASETFPDSIILQKLAVCQAIHESHMHSPKGASTLALKYNNLFGIKGKGSKGSKALPTWEDTNGPLPGGEIRTTANWAWYADHAECFQEYKRILNKPRYERVRSAKTIQEACKMIWVCGWATDPKYPQKLMAVYTTIVSKAFES